MPDLSQRRRVLLVEDEAMARTLLSDVLRAADFDVLACRSAVEAMRALGEFDPDAVITDIDLGPGPSGLELVVALERLAPYLAFVSLSNYAITPDYRGAALGRVTYLRKQDLADTEILLLALESALRDQHQRPPASSSRNRLDRLTPAQVQVLRMLAEGCSNDEIARRRGTSLKSVEHMIGRLFEALGLVSDPAVNLRVAAARIYLQEAGVLGGETPVAKTKGPDAPAEDGGSGPRSSGG